MGNFFRLMKFLVGVGVGVCVCVCVCVCVRARARVCVCVCLKSPISKLCWFYMVHRVFYYVKSLVILHSKPVFYHVTSLELTYESIHHLMKLKKKDL